MAGIYIHIPFCRQACHYCNFHFSTSLKYRERMVKALIDEIQMMSADFPIKQLTTIYFGGGTPSILDRIEIAQILKVIHDHFDVVTNAEITLEANPDDLHIEQLEWLFEIGVNRLSIGVQSFEQEHLEWMNRSHNADQAIQCIDNAKTVGFKELNVDLIFAIPGMSTEMWEQNIDKLIEFDVSHWSCYNLTVEPKTALQHMVEKNKVSPVSDEIAAEQYLLLMAKAGSAGMEHYEISNFSKPGQYARHNTSYWKGIEYLGIGPSAHSFYTGTRKWNVANNANYMKGIEAKNPQYSTEAINEKTAYNEYVMTRLRTMWGCKIDEIERINPKFSSHFQSEIQGMIKLNWVQRHEQTYVLTDEGKLYADHIASELFLT